jgi:hypothetical protein
MKIIDQLLVPRNRGVGDVAAIQLLAGDLAAIPLEHAVDALVVSAPLVNGKISGGSAMVRSPVQV